MLTPNEWIMILVVIVLVLVAREVPEWIRKMSEHINGGPGGPAAA
jgi:Sec-independent protein translocase protein TatA